MEAAIDFTMENVHLSAIVHAFVWAQLGGLKFDAVGARNRWQLLHTLFSNRTSPEADDQLTAAVKTVLETWDHTGRMENIQAKWAVHAAHGLGHGLTDALGVQQALEVCHASGAAMASRLPATLSGRVPMMSAVRFSTLCANGAWHTETNLLSAAKLKELARDNIMSSHSYLCGKLYPLPTTYAGPLHGTHCEVAGLGLDEADARIELVRLGACDNAA